MKKPTLPSKIISHDQDNKKTIEHLAWYINQLISYIKYLEETIEAINGVNDFQTDLINQLEERIKKLEGK